MADDQQLSQPSSGPGLLPSLVPGLQGTEASALQLKIKSSICKAVQSNVDAILQDIEKFTDIEKLYLYLKLPCGTSIGNERSEQSSMSSSRTQQMHAFNWIRNHLEEHPETSLPKQEVYDEYKIYCDNLGYHALSPADFGKIMKNVFPNMKARRLGMRGKSKYCYSGLRKKAFVHMPSLPNLELHKTSDGFEVFEPAVLLDSAEQEVRSAACGLVCEWAQKVLSRHFDDVEDLARYLLSSHYIGTKSVAALTVMTGSPSGVKTPVQTSAFVSTTDVHAFQPQMKSLPSSSIDAKQQLQRKIQKKQQEQKLHSPLPGDAQGRRPDSSTPGSCTSIPCRSPALLSPQPTIGIVVAASPITVQRCTQVMASPSPVPMTTSEGKVLPVNFQMVTPVQSVKQSPKTPQNIPASPVGDRSARHRQILPKPPSTTPITLRSPPTLLIANKTVMPTSHVSSMNVVKMTTISLGSTTTSTTNRPASTGLTNSGHTEEHRPSQQAGSGPAMPLLSSVARSEQITPTSTLDVKIEAITERKQSLSGANRLGTTQEATGLQWMERNIKPRAASVPTPLAKASPELEMATGTNSNRQTPIGGTNMAAGSNNNSNNESTLSLMSSNTSTGLSSSSTASPTKESSIASPRKRPCICTESSPTPAKRVFVPQYHTAASEAPKLVLGTAKKDVFCTKDPQTPVRSESAPISTSSKSRVPTRIMAHSDSILNTGFQLVKPQDFVPGINEDRTSAMELGGMVPCTQTIHVGHINNVPADSDTLDQSAVIELKSAIWSKGHLDVQQQQQQHQQQLQQIYSQEIIGVPKQMSMPMMDAHPVITQAPASGQMVQIKTDFGGSHPNVDYFHFHDDDMTQDSIVEELVQMEEQMKLKSLQSLGGSVDMGLQGQTAGLQNSILAAHQTGGQYYNSIHSNSAGTIPIPTPTPTPTPTSEMIGGGQSLTRESPSSRLAPTTPVDSALGSSRQTPVGTPHSSCSSSVPPSPVECRNPFAFTPISSSITGYHDGSIVSSSPVKPMQRPMATHPDKAKLEWMNTGYNSGGGTSNSNGISIPPNYQDLVDDQFRKPHAFAIPSQSYQSQPRHHDTHISRLTPVSPVHPAANLNKQEGFAVPAPLDNKISSSSVGSGMFRCRSVSPAVRQRNLSGNTALPNVPRSVVSPFGSPVTPEMLSIFAGSHSEANPSSMAQRSQSVPLNVMMQSEVLPLQAHQSSTSKNITNVLLSKMDGDGDDTVRGLGMNNLASNYTARMNLTQILETTPSFPGSANHQATGSTAYEFQKPGYLIKTPRIEQVSFSANDGQVQPAVTEPQEQNRASLMPQPNPQQQRPVQAPLDFNSSVKDLLGEDGLNPQLVGRGPELNAVGSDFPGDIRLTSELSSSINDLNTLDTNLLFNPNQQQGQYDSTLEELNNDPLFQQICSETANSTGFDWLESKDQATVEMLG